MKNIIFLPLLPLWDRVVAVRLSVGHYEKAEALLNRMRDVAPRRRRVHLNLGLVLLARGKPKEAEREVLLEIEYHGETYPAIKTLGDLYFDSGNREKAVTYYRTALERCRYESDRRLMTKRIEAMEDPERYAKAMTSRDALKKGRRLASEHDYEGAYTAFEKAIEYDAHNPHALNDLGILALRYRKDPERAVAYLTRAAELTRVPTIHANLSAARRALSSKEITEARNDPRRKRL